MTDTTSKIDTLALLRECRMGLSVLLSKENLDYDPSDQARELLGRLDQVLSETPHHCLACSVEVRGLYAVAHNTVAMHSDPERWDQKIDERMDELQAAVDKLTPIVEAHFTALGRR